MVCQALRLSIPAHERSDAQLARLQTDKAEISRRKVELLVELGVIGDVHLAIHPDRLPAWAEQDRRVVIEPRRAALEEARQHTHARLRRRGSDRTIGGAIHGLRQIEEPSFLHLTEVRAREELLQTHELGALLGRLPDAGDGPLDVDLAFLHARHLHDPDPNFSGSRLGRPALLACAVHRTALMSRIPNFKQHRQGIPGRSA
jgi:hypothetical protein